MSKMNITESDFSSTSSLDVAIRTSSSKPAASVLDLGSNSVKLSHYAMDTHNTFKLYSKNSVRLKLFEGLTDDGIMRTEYIDRTVDILKLFKEKIDFEGIHHIVAVATSAIRDAKNRNEIINRIHDETGFDFKILSDADEAQYSYAGAIRMLHIPSVLFFDLGGGSLEVVVAKDYKIKSANSFQLGALRLTQKFSNNSEYKQVDFDSMKKHISKTLLEPKDIGIRDTDTFLKGDDASHGNSTFAVVGVGGALRSITKYVQAKKEYPLSKTHNYELTVGDLEDMWKKISDLSPEKIAKISTISTDRADTIRAAVLVILQFLKKMGSEKIIVSAHGLREGALALSLQHYNAFNSQRVDKQHIRETVLSVASPLTALISSSVEGLINILLAANLLRTVDRPIIHYALEQTDRLVSFRDASNILYNIMDDDSHLSHGDQLFAAFAIMNTRKRRKSDTNLLQFEAITGPYDKKWIRRLSSIISLYQILHKSSATMTPELGKGGSISLIMHPKPQQTILFPKLMLQEVCEQLTDAFGIPFKTKVPS